jgi:hypothetical protein
MMTRFKAILVFVAILAFSVSVSAQTVFYAGHAGGGGGEANPGAFSSVDLTNGQVSIIGVANVSGGGVAGLASDGITIYAALAVGGAAQLVTINPVTGTVASTIGDVILSGGGVCAIGDLAMGNGILYGMTSNGSNHVCDGLSGGLIVTIDTTTAVATAVGRPFGTSNIQGGLAVDGSGDLWLSPGWNHPDPGNLYILNKTTGQIDSTLALSGDFPNDEGANGLVWNPDNGLLYASFEQDAPGNTSLWAINSLTGVSQLITNSTAQLHDIVAFGPGVPPSPALPVPALDRFGFAILILLALSAGLFGLRRFM